MKKIFSIITVLTVAAMIIPQSAQALTADELEVQIKDLSAQLSALQTRLSALLQGTTPTTTIEGIPAGFTFTKNLSLEMKDADVVNLKIVLAAENCLSGVANTNYFGSKTLKAVKCFQLKYKDAISEAAGYNIKASGFVGTGTRAKLNTLLGVLSLGTVCGNGTCETGETSSNCPADCPVTQATAAGLTVSLAADTPVSASIASGVTGTSGSNINFTKFSLTAGSEAAVSVSKIYVTRTDLSANADIENIKVIDASTGEYKGSIGSLNVDNRAMISFIPNLVIPAGTTKSFYIRAGVPVAVSAGKTAKLGIAAASDIVSDASAISGSFPITGNAMTVVTLTIGSLTVSEDGSTINSAPDVGDTDVVVLNWKGTAGPTEAVTIETVTVKRTGTADASDTLNIELYDVTKSQTLGTVANWSSDDKATWSNLGIVIGKGETRRFKIMLDIAGGVSSTAQTVNVDLVDGSDCLVTVKGNNYGFYITAAEGDFTGKGAADQSINAGALNISKSAKTPATGNISAGDDIVLAAFDFEAKGEDVKISALTLDITRATITCAQITNVSIYDESGTIVAGPQDCSSDLVAYTDTFIVPVGTHNYTVKAKIADAVTTASTVKIGVDRDNTTSSDTASGTITAVGMTSNDTIYPTPYADIEGNTLTVAAADLNVDTLASPSTRSVARGISDFVFATFSLDAGTSGEDINVTNITVTDSNATYFADINGTELWADLTSANSSRGDIYETRISDTKQPSAVTQAYTLTQTVKVPLGTFVKIALVGDIDGSATAAAHSFTIAVGTTSVTSTGASTGSSVTEDITVTNAQTMTVAAQGTLTVTQDTSKPDADILLGDEIGTLNVFRLAADEVENMDVDDITLYVTGGEDVDTYYFYKGDTLLGTRPGGTGPRLDLASGTLIIPANGNVKVTVKAKVLPVDGTSVVNNTDLGASINAAAAIGVTGLASGADISSTEASVAGVVHQIYESRPYFVASTGYSETDANKTITAPSSTYLLAKFNVTAGSAEDVTFTSSNNLVVQIEATVYDSDGTAGIWYLKDSSGTTYASTSLADTALTAGSSIEFLFDDATFTVPAGGIKTMWIYGDLSDFEDEGTSGSNSIQLWLSDSANANCEFSIDGTGTYAEGAIIFRGDIKSVSHSN